MREPKGRLAMMQLVGMPARLLAGTVEEASLRQSLRPADDTHLRHTATMALPIKTLIAAATMLAKDERAQRVAKSLWDKGKDAWDKRQSERAATAEGPAAAAQAATQAGSATHQSGWQRGGDRQLRFQDGQTGDLIRFAYTDEHGLTCQRTVGNWHTAGGQLIGYCLNRKQGEHFAIDRIGEWEELPMHADR